VDCTITRNIEADDRATLFDSCRLLLSYEDDVTRYAFTLIWAVRVLIKEFVEQPIPDQIRSLAEATIGISERHIKNLPPEDAVGNARAYLANISRKIDLKFVSRRTLVLFRSAIDGSNKPNAELCSTAADVALRFAKSLAREGRAEEAASLFADAAQWYERAFKVFDADPAVVSENFLPVVCHSKVGEAYLRMRRGIGGSVAIVSKAIAWSPW
jgi:hypothetical protein